MSQKGKTMEEFDKIDVTLLLMDFLRTLRFMWVRVLVLAVIGAGRGRSSHGCRPGLRHRLCGAAAGPKGFAGGRR